MASTSINHPQRLFPADAATRQINAFGRVFAVDVIAKFYRPQSYYDSGEYRGTFAVDGGGSFMMQACHNLDVYTWLFAKPAQVVSMLDTYAHNVEIEDHGAALMRHDNGMIWTIVSSTAARPGYAGRLEVHTDKGSFTVTYNVISDWQIESVDNPTDPNFVYTHDVATSASVSDTTAHKFILRDFENAIKTGAKPIASAESARLTTELILEIYRNAL